MPGRTNWYRIAAGLLVVCGATMGFGAVLTPVESGPDQSIAAQSPTVEGKRDRYGDQLPSQALTRMGTVRLRHPGRCQTLSYALGGKVLVSTGFGSVRLWDAETGEERTTLGGRGWHADEVVNASGVSKDGKTLIVHGLRKTDSGARLVERSYVWDIAARRELRPVTVRRHQSRLAWDTPHRFAPTDFAMAELRNGGEVWLWDAAGHPTHVLADAVAGAFLAAFTPDGQALVTCDDTHLVQVWDVKTGKRLRSFGGDFPRPYALALTPDGKHAATIAQVGVLSPVLGAAVPEKVRIWDVPTGKLIREIEWDHAGWVNHRLFLTFSPDGSEVIVADECHPAEVEVRHWRRDDGKLLRHWKIPARNNSLSSLAVRPDGRQLAVGTDYGVIRLFDLESGKETTPTNLHLARLTAIAFSSEGRELRSVAQDGTVRTWDAGTGKPLHSWRYEGGTAELTRDGAAVLDSRYPGMGRTRFISVRDARTGQQGQCFDDLTEFVQAPDGKTVWAMKGIPEALHEVNLTTGALGRVVKEMTGRPLAVTQGGQLVITHDWQRFFGWDSDTGKTRFQWSIAEQKLTHFGVDGYSDALHGTDVSADGRLLGLIFHRHGFMEHNYQASMYVCGLATGKTLWKIKSPGQYLTNLTFRPDGKVLAVGGLTVKLYDAVTGKVLADLDGRCGRVSALAFSADGKRLASGAEDGTALVWDVGRVRPE